MRTQERHIGTELNNKAGNSPAGGKGQGKQRHQPCFRHALRRWISGFCIPHQRSSPARTCGKVQLEARKPGRPVEESLTPTRILASSNTASHWKRYSGLKEEYGYKGTGRGFNQSLSHGRYQTEPPESCYPYHHAAQQADVVQENGRKYSFKPDLPLLN